MATGAELQFLISMRDQASATIRQLGSAVTDMGSNAQNAAQRMREFDQATRTAAVGVGLLAGAAAAAKGALSSFGGYDKTMTVIQRTTAMSADAMKDFSDQFDVLSGKMRATPVDRLQAIAVQSAQLGIQGTGNILRFTETVAKLESSLTDLGTDAPKMIVRVLNATGEGIGGVEKFGTVLVQMAKSSSSAESTILSMTATLAQSTARFHVASEALLGFATAAADLNFQPDLFGSAVGRTLTQLQDAAINDTQAFRDLAKMTNLNRDAWLDLLKNDPTQAMIRFAEVVKKIGADGKSTLAFYTSLNLQADENRRVTDTMAANIDKFREAQEEARTEAQRQIATNQEFTTTLQAYNVQVQAATNAWSLFSTNIGRALAPAATAVLNVLTNALEGLNFAFKGLDASTQQAIAWAAVTVPAIVGVMTAFTALRAVMVLTGSAALFTGAISGITGLVAGLMAAAANIVRVVTVVASLTRVGAIVLTAVEAIGAFVATIVSAPVLITLAITAAIASVVYLGVQVYNNWEKVKAVFAQPIGDILTQAWSGLKSTAASILDGVLGYVSEKWESIKSIFRATPVTTAATVIEEQIKASVAQLDALKNVLANQQAQYGVAAGDPDQQAKIKAAAEATANDINQLQLKAAQQAKDLVKAQLDELVREMETTKTKLAAANPLDAATTKITQSLEIIKAKVATAQAQLAKLNAQNAPANVIAIPGGLAGGVKLPGTTVDNTQPVSELSDVYQKAINSLDTFSKKMAEVKAQRVAFDTLMRLPADDRFFKDLGLADKAAVDYYRKRIEGELKLKELQADPVEVVLKALREQTEAAAALTAEEKNRLEVIVNIRKETEKKGALDDAEIARITAATQALQAQKAATTFRSASYDNDKALVAAKAITQEQKNQAEIQTKIADYIKQNGQFQSEADKNHYAAQLGSLQQINQFNQLRDSLNPIGTANRKFSDDVLVLNKALSDGTVTLEQYNMLMRNLKTQTLEQRDPFAAQVKSMKELIEVQRIGGDYAEADQKTQQSIIQFRQQGLDLTKEQTAALSEYNRAMQDAGKAQNSGLEGWAKSVGSMRDNVLDLQRDLVTSFSSSLTESITGADATWTKFLTGITKQITSMMVNQLIKGALEGSGALNSESSASFKAASAAADKLGSLGNSATQTMNVTATTVNLGGAGAATATALAGLGGGPTMGAGGAAGAILSGNAIQQSVALLKKFEGFSPKAYWDVNAQRTGYGSDTKTDAITGAVSRVTAATTVTRADADADLARRIPEFQKTITNQIGGVWESLTDNVKAGLTSVAYNYGHLPSSVQKAALTGDSNAIANAVQGLSGANGGVNANRRAQEADLIRNGGGSVSAMTSSATSAMEKVTGRVVATLEDPQTVQNAVKAGSQAGVIGAASDSTVKSSGGLESLFSGVDIPKAFGAIGGAIGLFGTYAQGAQAKSGGMAAVGGAISGASSGFMLGSSIGAIGGPAGAIGGALIGGLMSFLGFGDSKKKQKEEEQKKAMQDYINNLTKINQLIATNNGDPKTYGRLGGATQQLEDNVSQAEQIAGKAGQWDKVKELDASFYTAVNRMRDEFSRTWGAMTEEMIAGFGQDGAAAKAASQMQALTKSMQGFVSDTQTVFGNDPVKTQKAQYAAQQELLRTLDPPEELSAVGKKLAEMRGYAGELQLGLTKLGMSATDAAAAVTDHMNKALDQLRQGFSDDLTSKINTAQGKGYLNDAKNLIDEVAGLQQDASAIGADTGQVDTYFTSAAQAIVDNSQLVGDAFNQLVAQFPDLAGRVHEFSEDSKKSAEEMAKAAAEALAAIQDRKRGYEDRAFAVNFSDNSLSTKLTAFDRSAEWEQWTEMAKGGQALNELMQTQQLERDKLIYDYNQATNDRKQSFGTRQMTAQSDGGLNSQLALFDRQAVQDRIEEVKNGGGAIVQLEAAQAAERWKIVKDYWDAVGSRIRGFNERYYTAVDEQATLAGKLAAFQRQAYQEQVEEAKVGGEAMGALVQAQGAEQQRIIKEYYDAVRERQTGFNDRNFTASNDNNTLAGQLAAFERQAQTDRAAEVKAGGEAMLELTLAQEAERAKIISTYYEAVKQRIQSFDDRTFAATNNADTLAGQLAAFDRQASYERLAEIKSGGEALNSLMAAQNAERQKLVDEYLKAIADRKTGYQDRAFSAVNDGNTLAGQLAAFERQAMKDRADEIKVGGEAINDLTIAQEAERAKIISDYYAAVKDRIQGFGDRLFAATNDTTTLAGQLAAFDRNALYERQAEVKAGGEAMVALEAAQAAERLKVINDFNKQQLDSAKSAFKNFIDAIKKYIDGLRAGADSPLDPAARLAEAQKQYNEQLALAQKGDLDAINGITGYSDQLLDAAKAYYASSQQYQDIFEAVIAQLTNLTQTLTEKDFLTDEQKKAMGLAAAGAADPAVPATSNASAADAISGNAGVSNASPAVSNDNSIVAELKALREEVVKLRKDVQDNTVTTEQGSLAEIQSINGISSTLRDGNRESSRQALRRS
jgi:GH24 family phage-related lysozyme (muramidase)